MKIYQWAAESLYHRFAWAYDIVAWLVSFGYWSQWRRDALGYLIPGKVLETGFGTGSLLIEMAQRGMDVVGLELSNQMHQITQGKLNGKGLAIKRVRGRIQNLPFYSSALENVLSTFPTNYIFHPNSLREVHRILFLHGRWVITGVGVQFKSAWKHFFVGWFLGGGENPWMEDFIQQAQQSGFQVRVKHHESSAYILPIIILEKQDA